MTSWISRLRRRGDASRNTTSAAGEADGRQRGASLATIEIYTASRPTFPAEVDRGGERITDLLNAVTALSIVSGANSETIGVEEILLVVPPPDRWSDARRRLHRIRRPLRMQVGPFEIEGHAHIPPGTRPSGYLFRANPRFVPLTDALIRRIDGTARERRLPVVITNFRRLDQIAELKPEDQQPVADERRA